MNLSLYILRWICTLAVAFLAGKLITKLRMPSILGWLITGMLLGPNAAGLLPQEVMNSEWYKLIITWMQCAFGLMLGTELSKNQSIRKSIDCHNSDTVPRNICFCLLPVCHCILALRSTRLSGICIRRHRPCNSSCTCTFYRTGIPHTRSRNRHIASNGSPR